MADPAIQRGLVIPAVGDDGPAPTPLEKITAARNALHEAIVAAPRTVADAAQLQVVSRLGPLTSRTTKAVGDARTEISAANQVRTQADAVQNVYDETTNYGSIGDRTAEGAARYEAETGQQVSARWHGFKCRDYARNLEVIIANLRLQKAQLPKSVHTAIDKAIARAEDRRAKLQAGWEIWNERYERDPTFGR
jgi:regulator of protease activity HflC (stomatin/prohibitin superfamily)